MRMRCLWVLSTLASVLMTSCIGVVTQQVSVREAEVSGLINHPPVHMTVDSAKGLVRFSPGFMVSRGRHLSGSLDSESDRDPSKSGNLGWNVTESAFGLGVDIGLGRSGSLAFGGEYGGSDGREVWNGYLGMAIHGVGEALGVRMDAGLCFRGLRHDAYTVVVTTSDFAFWGSSSDTAFYHDLGVDRAVDFYASLTLNTKSRQLPVNLFLNACIMRQTLLRYKPSTLSEQWFFIPVSVTGTSVNATCRVVLLCLTPGLSFRLGDRQTLLLGGRIAMPVSGSMKTGKVVSPFVQMDFTL